MGAKRHSAPSLPWNRNSIAHFSPLAQRKFPPHSVLFRRGRCPHRPAAPSGAALPQEGVSKEGGPRPSLFGRFKDGGFSRGKGNRNPFPLEWRFWLLLSLLTKVTRRRQNKKGERKKGEIKIPRFLNCSLVTLFRGKSIPPGAKKGKHFGRMWASAPTNV